MLGILLISALMAIALAVYLVRGQREFLRESVLIGFVLWGAAIFTATESLSLFHALGFWEILIFWVMVLVLCLFIIGRKWQGIDIGTGNARHWPFLEKVFFNRIVFFSACLGIIGLFSPPNTYDAMTYHMSRVMHWIQDGSLTYYPTHVPRQLYYPAFAEYVILHFQLLSGGDHWANLVQWLAMCGSLVGVSLIARELGVGRMGQILSALIAVTIPMGVLQSSSTQTDYVGTLWIGTFIYFLLCWRRTFSGGYALLAGTSLGLAINTKGIALIFAAPFLLWVMIEALQQMKIRRLLMIGLMVCLAGVLYAGNFYRNTVYFHGNGAGAVSADADSLVNARFCWQAFGANLLRNTGLHLILPSTEANKGIEQGLNTTASFFHIDLNHKDWSYMGYKFADINFSSNEDSTGNFLHLLLFGIVLVLFAIFPRFRNRDAFLYLAACLLGWVLFNAILKWQPWNTRFHLPIFVIFAPIAGLVMERFRKGWIVSGITGALFLSAWAIVFFNISKPIVSSMSIFYPPNRPGLYFVRVASPNTVFSEYELIARALDKMGCKNIGLIMGPDEPEYLLWVALNPSADRRIRIESVLVNNASAAFKYPLGDFVPEAIIAINDDRSWVSWNNNIYQVVWHSPEGQGKKASILMRSPLS